MGKSAHGTEMGRLRTSAQTTVILERICLGRMSKGTEHTADDVRCGRRSSGLLCVVVHGGGGGKYRGLLAKLVFMVAVVSLHLRVGLSYLHLPWRRLLLLGTHARSGRCRGSKSCVCFFHLSCRASNQGLRAQQTITPPQTHTRAPHSFNLAFAAQNHQSQRSSLISLRPCAPSPMGTSALRSLYIHPRHPPSERPPSSGDMDLGATACLDKLTCSKNHLTRPLHTVRFSLASSVTRVPSFPHVLAI